MSLGLWCVGVELGGGGRRQGEGQVGPCRADGPETVKDGHEACLREQEAKVANYLMPKHKQKRKGGWQDYW